VRVQIDIAMTVLLPAVEVGEHGRGETKRKFFEDTRTAGLGDRSLARRALGVVLAHARADVAARLASVNRALRSDARRAPQLAFGPESALWRRSGDDADGTLTEILTRHRPGRLQRLVLCPPARRIDDAGAGFVACSLSPATVQFAARAQLRLRCLWTEPGSMRPDQSARLPVNRGVVSVTLDREDCVAIVTRGQCTGIPRAVQNTGIHAPALTRLSVGAAAEMTDAGIRTVLRSCRKLRSLEVTDGGGELMGLDWGGVGRDADVPTLQYLRLARCGHLRALRLTAPMLRSMAATDCDALRDLALAPSTGVGDGAMTDLRELTLGGFGGYRAGGGCKVPGNALADIVARCANLSFLSVPASCGAGMSDEEIAEIWSAALAGCASSLETLCFQVPVTTTALLLIVSSRGGEFPGLETLSVAMRVAAGGDGEPPINAGNVADDLVAAVSPCPAIRTLTLVDPPPELPTSVEEAAVTHAKMLASVELARGALAARCRLAEEESDSALGRELAVTVEGDFRGVAGRARTADAPTPGGMEAVLRECDECAPLEWSLDDA
jgi:hypothetical protein